MSSWWVRSKRARRSSLSTSYSRALVSAAASTGMPLRTSCPWMRYTGGSSLLMCRSDPSWDTRVRSSSSILAIALEMIERISLANERGNVKRNRGAGVREIVTARRYAGGEPVRKE